MKQENEITQELNEMGSMLAGIPRVMPYPVPEGYFTGVSAATREQIMYEADPETIFCEQTPFTVPEGYFDSFPGKILHTIRAEYKSIIPPSKMPFEAPEGYFEQLPGRVLAAVKQDMKSIPLPIPERDAPLKRILSWKPLRQAIAAMLVTGAGLGFYQLIVTSTKPVAQKLSLISKEDVRAYVLQHIDEFETEDLLPAVQLASIDKKSFTPAASGLSGEDIVQYLDETGWDTELH